MVIEDQESVIAWVDQSFGLAATRALDYFGKLIIEHPGLPAKPHAGAARRTAVPTSESLAGMQALKVALHPEQVTRN
jgi:hypothetical protein